MGRGEVVVIVSITAWYGSYIGGSGIGMKLHHHHLESEFDDLEFEDFSLFAQSSVVWSVFEDVCTVRVDLDVIPIFITYCTLHSYVGSAALPVEFCYCHRTVSGYTALRVL